MVNGIIRQHEKFMKIKQLKRGKHSREGFFLIEIMIAIGILVVVLVGYLQMFVYCLGLVETSGNITLAIAEAQDKLEELRNYDFNNLAGVNGDTFNLTQLSGQGTIYVQQDADSTPNLLDVEIVISWQDKGNRMIGGLDDDGDGKVDSPVELISKIASR